MLDSTQRSRDLLKGPMGDDEQFPVIDPQWGESPPPVFSVSYATTMPSGQGEKGVPPRYQAAATPLGPKTLKSFIVLPLVALFWSLRRERFGYFLTDQMCLTFSWGPLREMW